ncbi:Hypothetical predicted protein [Olea europaea subsp. europaea]|uniref:Uncharacterized protein n=1 Tax=Olea europaea subsp. europaea TaxID=158383 RepID=A0A8S0QBB3_OLEEU|nr:Hypothetical predicted protein [Olea europaea subsp. europaea]
MPAFKLDYDCLCTHFLPRPEVIRFGLNEVNTQWVESNDGLRFYGTGSVLARIINSKDKEVANGWYYIAPYGSHRASSIVRFPPLPVHSRHLAEPINKYTLLIPSPFHFLRNGC